jgi:homocysteine S-methyltransferase
VNPLLPGRILVEVDPPTSLDVAPVISAAKSLKKAGASAITIADNPLASVRVDTLTVSAMVQQKAGIPVIPHLTGRDRNRIAIQSTIMGAHVLGIRSLLCVTGDPVRMCEEPNTSGVFDVNSVGLVRLVNAFNAGERMGRDCQTAFSVGVALNPNVRSIAGQMVKLKKKVDAGAHFALTQPVFSLERLDMLESAMEDAGIDIPVYVGILPLTSLRNADFLHNEVPGIYIPEDVREALSRYTSVADQRAAGVEIAARMIREAAPRAHGFYIITPRNRADVVIPLISAAR